LCREIERQQEQQATELSEMWNDLRIKLFDMFEQPVPNATTTATTVGEQQRMAASPSLSTAGDEQQQTTTDRFIPDMVERSVGTAAA